MERTGLALIVVLAWLAGPRTALAQDLEPRRWAHMPVDSNVVGVTYVYTEGDLLLDPVLEIQDARVEVSTLLTTYTHAFDLSGKTGRLDVTVPFQEARWEGLLQGAPASVRRDGFADPWLRLSVNLAGAPALKGEKYLKYRAEHPIHTVVGAAVGVGLPLASTGKTSCSTSARTASSSVRRQASSTRAGRGPTS